MFTCFNCSLNESTIPNIVVRNFFKDNINSTFEKLNNNLTLDQIVECHLLLSPIFSDNSQTKSFKCEDVASVVVSMQEGYKCFTYFSDIFGDMTRTNGKFMMDFERFPEIDLSLFSGNEILPEEANESMKFFTMKSKFAPDSEDGGLYLVLHSPLILPYMEEQTMHRIKQNRLVEIRFVKMIEKLKPSPYKTDCYSYNSEQRIKPGLADRLILLKHSPLSNSGLNYYRSHGECFLYCMWRLMNYKGCVDWYSIFTIDQLKMQEKIDLFFNMSSHYRNHSNQIHFCPLTDDSYSKFSKNRKTCNANCKNACVIETYSIESFYDTTLITSQPTSQVRIVWSTKSVVYISHQEKFTTPGFIGNIGGHAHIWLGISIIHLFRFIFRLLQPDLYFPKTSSFWIVNWYQSLRGFPRT